VASVRFPPVVQALTVHWGDCPRSVLACALATATQRLTCVVCDTVVAVLVLVLAAVSVAVAVLVAVGVGFCVMVRVGSGVGVAEALTVLLGVADGDALLVGSVLLFDVAADGVVVGVVVGLVDSDGDGSDV
jgi:hypothetical protein